MTIRELAERTGMTVRNIRAHQTRGLLPPPIVRGRTGYYGPEHVARIELTREMQADGLNLEAIRRVLDSGDGSAAGDLRLHPRPAHALRRRDPGDLRGRGAGADLGRGRRTRSCAAGREKARHPPRPARRPDRGDQPAAAARRRRTGGARRRRRGRPADGREAAPPRRRRRPRLRRPLRQGGLGAVRPRRPARGRVAADERGARTDAAAGRRRPARHLPDRDGGGGGEGERAHAAARRRAEEALRKAPQKAPLAAERRPDRPHMLWGWRARPALRRRASSPRRP